MFKDNSFNNITLHGVPPSSESRRLERLDRNLAIETIFLQVEAKLIPLKLCCMCHSHTPTHNVTTSNNEKTHTNGKAKLVSCMEQWRAL